MLHLGIDQHKRQLTVNLRGDDGSVILKRQVSTQWKTAGVRTIFAAICLIDHGQRVEKSF